jgi:hypothetical protein
LPTVLSIDVLLATLLYFFFVGEPLEADAGREKLVKVEVVGSQEFNA